MDAANTHNTLTRSVCWMLIVMLALPPGFGLSTASAASRRNNTMTRGSRLETFRNPMVAGHAANRFLETYTTGALTGGGGDSFNDPGRRGNLVADDLLGVWLAEEGQLVWEATDLWTPGVGMDLSFRRVNRHSVTTYDGPLGEEWDFNWNKRLFEDTTTDDVDFHDMGRIETYTESSGSYTSPVGRYDTLAKDTTPNPDIFTRTDKYGIEEEYEYEDTSGGYNRYRLTTITDLNGNTITFDYDVDGNLETVTDTLGQETDLTYDANDRITEITDHAGREWEYSYNGNGELTARRTPTVDEAGTEDDFLNGKTNDFTYKDDKLECVFRPKDVSASWHNNWDSNGILTQQRRNMIPMTFTYDSVNSKATVEDRRGHDIEYWWDSNGRITKRKIVDMNATTLFEYDSDNEVTLVTFSRGNRIAYEYDSDGNITSVQFQEDSSDTTDPVEWEYTYTTNSRLDTMTDPLGRVWDYDYDSDGNLTKRTAPAVTLPSGIATSDKNGNSVDDGDLIDTWEYNSSGQVTKWTDASGTVTEYEYTTVNSKSAYLKKIKRDTGTGNLNLVTEYQYDTKGNVTKIIDPEGNETTFTVNDLNQVIKSVEPLSVTKKWHYDSNDQLIKYEQTNDTAQGNSWFVIDYTRDTWNNVTNMTEDVTASLRLETDYQYDDRYLLTKLTDPEGRVTEYEHNVWDGVDKITRKAASSVNDAVTTYTFDRNGNRTKVTDPLGNETIYTYDKLDRLEKVTQPEGNYVKYEYDDAGNRTKVQHFDSLDNKLAETETKYDEANRVYSTTRMAKKADLSTNLGDGKLTETVWRDEMGRVLEYSDDACGCSDVTSTYDAVGRRTEIKDQLPTAQQNSTTWEYDDNGNVTKITRKDKSQDTNLEGHKDIETTMVYDARDRMTTRSVKLDATTSATTTYTYGDRDQITKVTDPEGDQVITSYNEKLWKTKEVRVAVLDTPTNVESNDVVTEWGYDYGGLVITHKAKNGTTGDQDTVYTFDNLGRLTKTKWPDLGETTHTYDKAGNRLTTTDPMGTVVTNTYDDNNRLTNASMTLATNVVGIDDIDYTYDGMGRITQADTAEGVSFTTSVERTYNTLGKIETETQVIDGYNSGNGRDVVYVWDEKGQKTSVTYPVSAQVVSYTRDDLERIDSIDRGATQVVDYTFSGPRVLKKEFPGSEALYTYDGMGRVEEIHHKDSSSGNTLAKFVYGWDLASQVISLDKHYYNDSTNTRILADTSDEGDQYEHDGAGRITKVLRGVPTAKIDTALATNETNGDYDDKVEYVYDQTGNREKRKLNGSDDVVYEYNKVNEMTKKGGVTQNYTSNGNWSGTANAYKYDFSNRLAEAAVGSDTYEWHYDALGRRVQQDDPNGDETRFYYDGIHAVEECAWNGSSETQTKLFVYGERVDELLEYVDIAADPDDTYYAHSGMLGSVQVLPDETGAIAESYRYREFGVTTVVNSSWTKLTTNVSAVGSPYRYTARRLDETLSGGGLVDDEYFYRARHLRPDEGRFTQRDRGYFDGSNLFVYAKNDPASHNDPLGLFAITSISPFGGTTASGLGSAKVFGGVVGKAKPRVLGLPNIGQPGGQYRGPSFFFTGSLPGGSSFWHINIACPTFTWAWGTCGPAKPQAGLVNKLGIGIFPPGFCSCTQNLLLAVGSIHKCSTPPMQSPNCNPFLSEKFIVAVNCVCASQPPTLFNHTFHCSVCDFIDGTTIQ